MSGVGSLDDPSLVGLEREALLTDHAAAAEFVEQVAGLAVVVAGIEMDRDAFAQALVEPAQML